MTDGTSGQRRVPPQCWLYYDLVKANVERIVTGLTAQLEDHPVTAVGVTPGWLRSEHMLENFGVTEQNWRDACVKTPGFGISESPAPTRRSARPGRPPQSSAQAFRSGRSARRGRPDLAE